MTSKYLKQIDRIIKKLQAKADKGNFYENFGEKEYRKFREQVNLDDSLSYSDKAELCATFSELTSHITPQS